MTKIAFIPEELESDGCSFPGPLVIVKGILGASKYHDYCREHDFLRRHDVIHWFRANLLLGERIASEGLAGKIRAPFYVVFTTISYPFYSYTEKLPDEWVKYWVHYNG